ncbi:MAG TPA: hypothetical protein VFU02_08525, partial [Polyangiaceae bacterium]|nr:hypothetical protein [Polyangiaceae bacterium]
ASVNVRHYYVNLRIRRSDRMDLWLLVNESSFPSVLDSVETDNEAFDDAGLPLETPREIWWFSGNETTRAYPLGRVAETSLQNLEVATSVPEISVTLGKLDVGGLAPQEWLRRTGGRRPGSAASPPVPVDFEPHCTTWFDVAAEAESQGTE